MKHDEIDDRRETPRPEPDRRENARRRVVLAGYVFFEDDEHVLPVRVSNLSDTGAKLHLNGLRPLPDRFTIAVPQRMIVVDVVVAWKTLPDLGVLFVAQPSPDRLLKIDETLAKLR